MKPKRVTLCATYDASHVKVVSIKGMQNRPRAIFSLLSTWPMRLSHVGDCVKSSTCNQMPVGVLRGLKNSPGRVWHAEQLQRSPQVASLKGSASTANVARECHVYME